MESLVRDIFPAEVVEPGGQVFTGARVFVTTERFIVWRMVKGVRTKTIDLNLTEPIEKSTDILERPLEIMTLTRGFLVNQGRGCGCHSPLRALGPPAAW
jgi:hypothetical protein